MGNELVPSLSEHAGLSIAAFEYTATLIQWERRLIVRDVLNGLAKIDVPKMYSGVVIRRSVPTVIAKCRCNGNIK